MRPLHIVILYYIMIHECMIVSIYGHAQTHMFTIVYIYINIYVYIYDYLCTTTADPMEFVSR